MEGSDIHPQGQAVPPQPAPTGPRAEPEGERTFRDDQYTQIQCVEHGAELVDDPRGHAGWVIEVALKRADAPELLTREELNTIIQAFLDTPAGEHEAVI